MVYELTHSHVNDLAAKVAIQIKAYAEQRVLAVYPIPRGGVPATYIIKNHVPLRIVDNPELADIFIDDMIDSGTTMRRYCDEFPGKPFFVLIDRTDITLKGEIRKGWISFPWEVSGDTTEGITENVTRIIQYIGDDPARGGLLETPARFQKALGEWFSGYKYTDEMIAAELKTFKDGAEDCDQMVIRKNIPLYSHCEHHIAAIFGVCTIAYLPDTEVIGLSKMDRLVDIFGKRLQVQERLTNQIANAMEAHLKPLGVGVWISARHMCVESRGVCNKDSETITTALRGVFRTEPETRAEFLAACRKQ